MGAPGWNVAGATSLVDDMVSFCNQPLVERTGWAAIPTDHGTFDASSFRDADGLEHIAFVARHDLGDAPLVRVHSECLTGDVFGSRRCDCGTQLDRALEVVGSEGGMVIYVRGHEGRGIGLGPKLRAYELQDGGMDTVDANHALGMPADARTYDVAAAILADLGVTSVRLLTNNPTKAEGLESHGVDIVERVPLMGQLTDENAGYLATKRDRMQHTL